MENREGRDYKEKENVGQKRKIRKRFSPRECWQCGKKGYFRSEFEE